LRLDLRRSLLRLFNRYSVRGGWNNEDNLTFEAVSAALLDRRGWEMLQWWDGKEMKPTHDFDEFIEKGAPHHVLDAIELFLDVLDDRKRPSFGHELNTLFEIHHSPLRHFKGEFYVIDSAFLESQVQGQAQQLLETSNFHGALDEFLQARSAFMEKDFKQTILLANHALESVLKAVLGLEKKVKTGELIKKVCHGELIPTYYEGFLDAFQNILSIVPTTRDNEAGHGQGKEVTSVPPALAELTLHLSASMIVFLIKRYAEKHLPQLDEEEIPF
jgi:hypothetical protein